MRIALVYDRINKWGGAERVLLTLHEMFPEAPLFTSMYDAKKTSWAKEFEIKTSFLQTFSFLASSHEFIPFLMPLAFEHLTFDNYDLVISVTSEAAKGILTKPKTKHICYCLTPTRYLWSGHREYFKNEVFKTLAFPAVHYLRGWDRIASHRPDTYVAASGEVRKRIQKYYQQDSTIIYPPLSLKEKVEGKKLFHKNKRDYFLVVSRFVSYKRIDLAITACNQLKLPLIIIGEGREEKKLKSLAGPTIKFYSSVTDSQLISYYKNCKALLFPGLEDFGLTIVEAQRFGKPVIAFKGGGALETVVEGKTGIFFNEQTKESLAAAIRNFQKQTFDEEACTKQAEKFSSKVFKKEFFSLVNTLF